MSEKQNLGCDEDTSSPARDEEQNETPKSYYYDDATGYEIYEEEADTEEEAEESDEEPQ